MKTLLKRIYTLAFYLGFLFWGCGFLIAFGQFVIYNGLGEFFDYEKPIEVETSIKLDSINKISTTAIYYTYVINDKIYRSNMSVATENIERNEFYETNIYYNKTFPYFSYIGNNKLRLKVSMTGMIVSSCFMLFFFIVYKFTNADRWIAIYTGENYKDNK